MVIKKEVKKEVENDIIKKLIEISKTNFMKEVPYASAIFFHRIESSDLYIPAHIFITGMDIKKFIPLIINSSITQPRNLPSK